MSPHFALPYIVTEADKQKPFAIYANAIFCGLFSSSYLKDLNPTGVFTKETVLLYII